MARTRLYGNRNKSHENVGFRLQIGILKANNIDVQNMGQEGQPRLYRAYGSLGRNREFQTCIVRGEPDPVWRSSTSVILSSLSGVTLELDVIRLGSRSDPGTSTGMVSVGRARISTPEAHNKNVTNRVELVKSIEGKLTVQGDITVVMRIERVRYY